MQYLSLDLIILHQSVHQRFSDSRQPVINMIIVVIVKTKEIIIYVGMTYIFCKREG